MKKTVKSLALLAAAAATMIVAACNTVEGLGKDIEKGGEKLQDAAD